MISQEDSGLYKGGVYIMLLHDHSVVIIFELRSWMSCLAELEKERLYMIPSQSRKAIFNINENVTGVHQ